MINAGVAGYSSYQGLLRFRREAPRYKPDLVLVAFGWNDLAPALGVPDKAFRPPPAPLLAARRLLLRYDIYLVARRYAPRAAPRAAAGPRVALSDYHANLRAFAELASAHGGRAVLLTRPHREPEPVLRARPGWRRQVPVYNRAVRRQAGRRGAVLIDVQRRFAGRPEPFVDECHFNAAGHRRMAALIARQLRRRGLLDADGPGGRRQAPGPRGRGPGVAGRRRAARYIEPLKAGSLSAPGRGVQASE